jgi:UDP-N-acetylmuramate dehydrogenase
MQPNFQKLKAKYDDRLAENWDLAHETTLNIGGPAKGFIQACTIEELVEIIKDCIAENVPYMVIGGGSNLLINDAGTDCLVIKIELEWIYQDGNKVTVFPGLELQELVDYTIAHKLAGMNKLTGIPGTIGGAVYGNAGAYGQTISDHLV